MGTSFKSNAELFHIRTKSIPIETAHRILIVERYHSPIRHTYNKITKESPELEKDTALQKSMKSVNYSVGREVLVPILLAFGALPRLGQPSDPPSPSMLQRARALRKATAAIVKALCIKVSKELLQDKK